jgi:hypothetical protein
MVSPSPSYETGLGHHKSLSTSPRLHHPKPFQGTPTSPTTKPIKKRMTPLPLKFRSPIHSLHSFIFIISFNLLINYCSLFILLIILLCRLLPCSYFVLFFLLFFSVNFIQHSPYFLVLNKSHPRCNRRNAFQCPVEAWWKYPCIVLPWEGHLLGLLP